MILNLITVFLLGMVPAVAYAYVDPGTGAYIVQAIIAVIASGLFFLRNPIRALKNLWKRITRRKE